MAENVVDMTIVLVMAPSSRRRLSSVHCPFSIDLRKEKEGSMEVTDAGRRFDIEREGEAGSLSVLYASVRSVA